VPKGSFHYFVPSKQALALAVVDEHWVWQRDHGVNILTDPAPIVERLRRPFVLTAEMPRSPGA
jgi:TetR/AcrR family transcriptional repressor of nem operon